MANPKRWKLIPIIFGVNVGLVIIVALLDLLQIRTFFEINTEEAWQLYAIHSIPAIWKMWLLIFVGMGVMWYIIHKDISESIGIALSGMILVSTGLEDLFYYMWSPQTMQPCMAYLNNLDLLNIASRIMGETCVSGTALVLNAIGGLILAIGLLYVLVVADSYIPEMKWIKRG